MSNTRRWKSLCAVLVAVICLTFSVFTVFADENPVAESDTAATGTVTSGAEVSPAANSQEPETATTGTEDSQAEPKDASAAASAAESVPATESAPATESSQTEQTAASNVPWKLIISVGVIVLVIAVLFILAKTKTKVGEKISKFFKDYKSELKKIVWMPWKDLLKATGIVLAVLLVAALLIGLLDYGFSSLIRLLSSIGK